MQNRALLHPGRRSRRRLLRHACAACASMGSLASGLAAARIASAAEPAVDEYVPAPRFSRPDAGSDEGGLWALMDREETKLRRSHLLMRDNRLRDYLTQVVCRLAGSHCRDVRVYPMRAAAFNASMAPNGMMQVWSGLLLRVENEAQLAAVIGHEVGHYLERHSLHNINSAKSNSAAAMVLSIFGLPGLVGALAVVGGMMAFSRDQEREADRISISLMRRAGYDPLEASRVWTDLQQEFAATPEQDPNRRGGFMSTHPAPAQREDELRRLAGAGGGDAGTDALRSVLAPHRTQLYDDELTRGVPQQSVPLFERLLKARSDDLELRFWRVESMRRRGLAADSDWILAELDSIAAHLEAPPLAYRSLGMVHMGGQRQSAARAAFERYLERLPQAPDAGMIRSYVQELTP